MHVALVQVDLLVVGSLSVECAAVAGDYERRLGRYVRLRVHEVKSEPLQRGAAAVARAEGGRLTAALAAIRANSATPTSVVVCDSRGAQPTSPELAERLLAASRLCLVIGGASGVSEEIARSADWTLSFGRITLPHQLARIVVTEQLYRSFRIARREPYHH